MTCTACLRDPAQTTGTARASTVGQEETYHVGPLVPRRAYGREARCPTGPQPERDVPRARRHAYRAPRPGGKVRGSGVPGWLAAPHGETNLGWRARVPAPTVPVLANPAEPRRRRSLLGHRAHRGTLPVHIPVTIRPQGQSGLLERKWCRPRPGPHPLAQAGRWELHGERPAPGR